MVFRKNITDLPATAVLSTVLLHVKVTDFSGDFSGMHIFLSFIVS